MRRAEERYAQEDGPANLSAYEDEWTEEDMRDLTAYSMKIAEERYLHEDDPY